MNRNSRASMPSGATAKQVQPASRPPATFEAYDPEAYGVIVHPNRFDWYLTTRWLPDLGNEAYIVVKVLRNELYYNPAKRALRDECEMSMAELARRCNLSRTKLFALFKDNWALNKFVERQAQIKIKGDRPHRDVNAFRVCMTDPIHPDDEPAYRLLLEQRGSERLAKEARAKFRVSREEAPAAYASQNGTHRLPMSPEKVAYESGSGTHMGDMSPDSERHKEEFLPSGVLTKEFLTPAAPPAIQRPPEGVETGYPEPLAVAWQEALLLLAGQVSKPTFETHIKTLCPVALSEGNEVSLAVPSAFTRSWIEKRHVPAIENALSLRLGRAVTVCLIERKPGAPP